jgi:Ran GTPase-activating protein (RanGAP) involved in mRNA processing and transport
MLLEIGRALQEENRTLQYVDIGNVDGVTDAVAQCFTAVMASGNTTFRSFECNLNGVSTFHYMSLQHMFCMDISDNCIGDDGCLVLAKCLPGSSIERINLAENGIHRLGASAIAWGIAQAKCLKILNICDNPVLEEGPAVPVTSADVRNVMNQVQGHSAYAHGFVGMLCAALQDHPNMEHLNLASTGLSDTQGGGTLVALLIRISHLQTLLLGRNNLGDETCGHLYSVLSDEQCCLSSLSLQVNSFTALGFYTLWHGVLRTNDTLQNLNIGLRTYDINGCSRGQKDINIALRLNKAGRVRLLKHRNKGAAGATTTTTNAATVKDWLQCLFRVANDTDCSYTLLRENPALCTVGTTTES